MGEQAFPQNWKIGQDFDPNAHLMNLKGRDYLNVQNRLLWFIRDQRALIVAGLAKMPYIVQSELVEMDRAQGWAHFKTYVRDVLGNEATMYGSESAKDFGDFAEKASTKSLGRALLALGYGTAFAPEMDEGERVVDTPTERKPPARQPQQAPQRDDHGGKWDYLGDVTFRGYVAERGYKTIEQVQTLVAEACGDGEPSKRLVQQELLRRANLQGVKVRGA